MAMLHQSKITKKYFWILIFIFSCENESKLKNYPIIETQILKKTNLEFRNIIIKSFNDTINSWVKNINKPNLKILKNFQNITDSLVCINSKKDKLLILKLSKAMLENIAFDAIYLNYGVKINENWYFFNGPTIQIPRDVNKLDEPTSFEKLHEIAMEEVFSGYLKENKKTGEWEINDAFFADFTSNAWYDKNKFVPKTQADWDKIYLQIVADNWKHKDTTNYERLRAEEMRKNN